MSAKLSKSAGGESASPRYTLITNVRLLDPIAKTDEICDILLKREVGAPIPVIEDIGKGLKPNAEPLLRISGAGLHACRSFVDLHAHTCDPGSIALEDIRTATDAAVAGGYGDLLVIPYAPIDWTNEELVGYLRSNFRKNGNVDLRQAFYLTRGNRGEELADPDSLRAAGINVFYEEGNTPLPLLFQGMERLAAADALLILRCNIPALCPNGNPISSTAAVAAETAALGAALAMAESTGCRLHITLVSTAASVDLIRGAKARGVKVTCDTAPQYFTFDSSELSFTGGPVKVDPPLRSRTDKQAVIRGLADGTIDCIVSDHTPVLESNKEKPLADALPGMLGLQTAFGLAMRELRSDGRQGQPRIDLYRIIELLTTAPAKILGLPERITVGGPAKLILLDLHSDYILTRAMLRSKSQNCPWIQQNFRGKVKYNFARIQREQEIKKAESGR